MCVCVCERESVCVSVCVTRGAGISLQSTGCLRQERGSAAARGSRNASSSCERGDSRQTRARLVSRGAREREPDTRLPSAG